MSGDGKNGKRDSGGAADEEASSAGGSYASPPCFMHEVAAQYAGHLTREETLELLNALLEAERAGVKVTAAYAREAADDTVKTALREVGRDEGRYCAMLTRHIERLGGAPTDRTGAFFEKAMTVAAERDRLAFLNRGQGWVVRKLRDALPRVPDDALHADLKEMLATHERNIARCDTLID